MKREGKGKESLNTSFPKGRGGVISSTAEKGKNCVEETETSSLERGEGRWLLPERRKGLKVRLADTEKREHCGAGWPGGEEKEGGFDLPDADASRREKRCCFPFLREEGGREEKGEEGVGGHGKKGGSSFLSLSLTKERKEPVAVAPGREKGGERSRSPTKRGTTITALSGLDEGLFLYHTQLLRKKGKISGTPALKKEDEG